MSCRCFSDRGIGGWRIAKDERFMQRTFSKVTKHDNWEEKSFITRFDVLSQDVESSKTPSSSPRFSGPGCSPNLCDFPYHVNTEERSGLWKMMMLNSLSSDPAFAKAVPGFETLS